LYTLKDFDYQVGDKLYPALHLLFLKMEDPTEWNFGNKYLESYDHWSVLCQCTWFKPYISRWRKELELQMKSELLGLLKETATSGSRDSFQAAKFLLEKKWVVPSDEELEAEAKNNQRKGAGRPSKEDIRKAAEKESFSFTQVNDDYERLQRVLTQKKPSQVN
tara:strand:+ start:478 stop:966 length:489 start_codon:yes stop_codon:yes gene_type:complete